MHSLSSCRFFLLLLFLTFCNLNWTRMFPQYCWRGGEGGALLSQKTAALPSFPATVSYPWPLSRTHARDHSWRDRCVPTHPSATQLLLDSLCFICDPLERSDQPQAFLKQKPHGVSNGKAFADWGLWQAGEAGAGALSERFDTPSNSPLSLALVSKQYSSESCSSAPSCCHTRSLSLVLAGTLSGISGDALGEGAVFINHLLCVGHWATGGGGTPPLE